MNKLVMTKGLPASGKSTWCKEQIRGNEKNNAIINRDSLRKMFHDSYWFQDRSVRNITESMVSKASLLLAQLAIDEGKDVYIDETNLSPKSQKTWKNFAEENGLEFVIKDFTDVSLNECIQRDSARDRSVGADVIKAKYRQYIKPLLSGEKNNGSLPMVEYPAWIPQLQTAVIFDIDGTLAYNMWRSPHDLSECEKDPIKPYVVALLNIFVEKGFKILLVSGRDSGLALEKTKEWAKMNGITYDDIFMRPANDNRRDDIIKLELYDKYIKGKYNIFCVVDDRNRTVDAWRSVGLTCYQCDYGDF